MSKAIDWNRPIHRRAGKKTERWDGKPDDGGEAKPDRAEKWLAAVKRNKEADAAKKKAKRRKR